MTKHELLNQRIEELKSKRGVDHVSRFDPELGFVTNAEEIRQIALRSCQTGDISELIKIHPDLEFAGLYPWIKPFYIDPSEKNNPIDPSEFLSLRRIFRDRKDLKKQFEKDQFITDQLQKEIDNLKNNL